MRPPQSVCKLNSRAQDNTWSGDKFVDQSRVMQMHFMSCVLPPNMYSIYLPYHTRYDHKHGSHNWHDRQFSNSVKLHKREIDNNDNNNENKRKKRVNDDNKHDHEDNNNDKNITDKNCWQTSSTWRCLTITDICANFNETHWRHHHQVNSLRHISLQWRHNDHDGVSNHQPHGCLLNRLFRRRSKKTSKPRVTRLLWGEFTGTGEFPAQRASYAENVSIWWRHHDMRQ